MVCYFIVWAVDFNEHCPYKLEAAYYYVSWYLVLKFYLKLGHYFTFYGLEVKALIVNEGFRVDHLSMEMINCWPRALGIKTHSMS